MELEERFMLTLECSSIGFRAEGRGSAGLLVLAQTEFVLDWRDGHQKINEPQCNL